MDSSTQDLHFLKQNANQTCDAIVRLFLLFLRKIVGDTWYSPYCLLALYSTQLDRQSATGTMNACASANDSRRVFAENHSSWEGQMWRMVPDLNPQKSLQNL